MPASRRAAPALDALAAVLLVLLGAIVQTGGFVLDLFGAAVSFRTPGRTVIWLLVVLAVRLSVDRRTGPFGIAMARVARIGADPVDRPFAPGLWRRVALAALGIAAALAVLLQEQIRNLYAVPDFGDPLFSIWRTGWVLHQLAAEPARLFHANIFSPAPLTLTFSDPMLLNALMAAPLAGAGVHPVAVYNALVFVAFWLSGIATYVLVERLTASPRAAFVSGLIYATYSYRFDHYSHLELQMTHWMPLGLLALHLFVATGRWRYAAALGLAGVLQLYSSMYYAVFFLVYVVVVGAALIAVRRVPIRRLLLPAAAAALAAGVLAAPLARAFIAAQPQKGERPVGEVHYYSARPFDYLRANSNSAIWHGRLLPSEPERALFPGAAPLALGALGAVPPLGAIQVVYAAGLLAAVDGSFGFNSATYPLLYRAFAPVRGLRVPARFGALVGLTIAILAGFGARRLLGRCRTPSRERLVFAALVAAVVIDAWPDLRLKEVWREPPGIYQALRERPDAVLAEFPVKPDEVFNLPFMYFSIWHWTPMVNGYSGFIPESYHQVEPDLLAFPSDASIEALRRRGVTHVTLNCGLRYSGCRETMLRMPKFAGLRLVTASTWEDRPVALYEIAPR